MENKSAYFFWDYDLPENKVKNILKSVDMDERNLVIARILEHAKWDDIWKFLTLKDIKDALPQLRINPKIKNIWEYAFNRWTNAR